MKFSESDLKNFYALHPHLGDFLFNTVIFGQDDDDEILATIDWWKKQEPLKYTVQALRENTNSCLTKTNGGDFYFSQGKVMYDAYGDQHAFTKQEIEELKQRDDIAIDWDKAIIKPVEDNEDED